MPSPDQLNQFLSALKQQGGSAGNVMLREALSWDEATYDAVKSEAVSQGKVAAGRGRGGSVKLVVAESTYSSGERPLDACPEVIGLSRFSAFVIRPIEELVDRTGARCEGPPSG